MKIIKKKGKRCLEKLLVPMWVLTPVSLLSPVTRPPVDTSGFFCRTYLQSHLYASTPHLLRVGVMIQGENKTINIGYYILTAMPKGSI